MTIDAGRGADTIEIGAWFDLLVSAGAGDERIDLSYAETDSQASHTLRGGAGDDVIVGSAQGRHVVAGGGGTDYLYGGDNVDVLTAARGLTPCPAMAGMTACGAMRARIG